MPPKKPQSAKKKPSTSKPRAAKAPAAPKTDKVQLASMKMVECVNKHCEKFNNVNAMFAKINAMKKSTDMPDDKKKEFIEDMAKLTRELKGLPTCAVKNCADELVAAFEEAISAMEQYFSSVYMDDPKMKTTVIKQIKSMV